MLRNAVGSQKQFMAKKKEEETRQRALISQQDKGVIRQVDDIINNAISMSAIDIHFDVMVGP